MGPEVKVTKWRLAGVAALAMGLSACSVGGLMPTGSTNSTQSLQNQTASPQEIAAATAALPAIATECPPIKIRDGQQALFFYGKGQIGNPRDLQYQAVIDKQSRNCVVSKGQIVLEMGAAGRLLLGPDGNQTQVTVPLNFTIERNSSPLYAQTYDIPVTIAPPAQSSDFVKVIQNVAIPYVAGDDIVIYVGFDTGKKG